MSDRGSGSLVFFLVRLLVPSSPSAVQRVWVIIAAIILLAFAIVAVSQCSGKYDAFCYVINIITIVGCIFGIIGACQSTKEEHSAQQSIRCTTMDACSHRRTRTSACSHDGLLAHSSLPFCLLCSALRCSPTVRLHGGWLNIFCVTLMVLIVLEIIFIIIALVGDYAARDILWNFVVLGLLCITLAFATDLRRVVHGSTVIY